MNKRTLFSLLMVLALLLMTVPGAVFAQEDEAPASGSIVAQGDGVAKVKGNGTATVTADNAKLVIKDRTGDAQISVTGYDSVVESTFTNKNGRTITKWVYRGFNGEATVTGSRIVVKTRGVNIDLSASGTGKARLVGYGTWTRTNNDGETLSGEWFNKHNAENVTFE